MNGLFNQFSKEFDKLISEFDFPLENKILVFSLLLFIILLSPVILKRFRIPSLIGLIIAGIIIGPNGFGLISEGNMKDGYVGMFSTFGLLYIMFMAGLELDMQQFKRYRNKSLVFGLLTFAIPLALGYPLCRNVLGLNEMASLLTASMFSTHTLVAYPIVSKYGISKTEAVAVAIGGTILTDTAVLIILSVISGSEGGSINTNVLIHLLVTLSIFSLIMFWLVPIISRWFFKKLESEKNSHYIYVMSVLFFSAFLAEAAGIEAIIGAFVAGLVMNRLIPHTSSLMNRIEFIGNSLFIPFFLIFIGMVVKVDALTKHPWGWAVAGILTTFAIFSKYLAALFTQLIFKLLPSERKVIFGLSTAHAAATLAIINVGYKMEIIDIDIVNGTIILILITSMTASFVTENAGKKLLIDQSKDEKIEGPALRTQHVMVAANELKGNEKVLDFSILITDLKVKNPISVVSVLENDDKAEANIRRSRKHMDDFVTHYSGGEISVNAMATIDHNFSSGIGRVSKELAADIVLINDDTKTNLFKRIIGDERDQLIDSCEKTIFFCNLNSPINAYRRVAVSCPIHAELEPGCNQWLERVMRIAKELNLDLDVYSTRETFEKFKAYRTDRKFGVDLTHKDIFEAEEILEKTNEIKKDTLFIQIFARKGSISAFSGLDSLAIRLDKELVGDRIYVYPSQTAADTAFAAYEDMNASPLTKGVETLKNISKEVGEIFKKSDK